MNKQVLQHDNEKMNSTMKKNMIKYLFIVFSILAGVIVPSFSIIVAGGMALYIFLESNIEEVKYLFIFLIPLSAIFKYGANSTSFVTILVLVGVIRFITSLSMDRKFVFSFFILLLFCFYAIGENTILVIKQLTIPIFVFFVLKYDGKFDKRKAIFVFLASILFASLIGMFKEYIPNLSNYIEDKSLRIGVGVYTNRFSGLNGDPNYYSVNILLSIALTIYLLLQKNISFVIGTLLIITFVSFGALTNSKSFIAILVCVLIFSILSALKNKKYKFAFILILGVIISVVLIASGRISMFNQLLDRFKADKTVSDLTTGRSDYVIMYLEYIIHDLKVLLFGNGINSDLLNGFAAHNTYVDFIYYYGLIGSVVWIYSIRCSINEYFLDKNIVNYLPLIVVSIGYMFLSELKYMDFQLHISLVLMMLCGTPKNSNSMYN